MKKDFGLLDDAGKLAKGIPAEMSYKEWKSPQSRFAKLKEVLSKVKSKVLKQQYKDVVKQIAKEVTKRGPIISIILAAR